MYSMIESKCNNHVKRSMLTIELEAASIGANSGDVVNYVGVA